MWDMPQDPEESPDKDTPQAEVLLGAMHAHSEERCAGWLIDQEFYLWSAVIMDGRWDAMIDGTLVSLLRWLADESGGWWIHGGPEGRTFLPLDVWKQRYAARDPKQPAEG